MDKMVTDFMGTINRIANPQDAFVLKVRAVYKHYMSVVTPEQRRVIESWCQACPVSCSYGITYSSDRKCIILGIYSSNSRIDNFCWVPFGTDSTTEDVQRFIQQLAMMEIHSS